MRINILRFGYGDPVRAVFVLDTLLNNDPITTRVEVAKGKVKEVTAPILDEEAMDIEGNIRNNFGNHGQTDLAMKDARRKKPI